MKMIKPMTLYIRPLEGAFTSGIGWSELRVGEALKLPLTTGDILFDMREANIIDEHLADECVVDRVDNSWVYWVRDRETGEPFYRVFVVDPSDWY